MSAVAVRRVTAPIRIVIADDHPLVLRGLQEFLGEEADFEVIARCRDGDEALAAIETHKPDVAIVDLQMPRKGGLEILRELRARQNSTRIILLAASLDEEEMVEAARLGVRGVVLKEMAVPLLIQCVRKVYAGESWLERQSMMRALEGLLRREASARNLAGVLTPRQIEIMRLVARGLSNKAVGATLNVSEGTVKTHVHMIYERLGLRSRAQLIVYCRERGVA